MSIAQQHFVRAEFWASEPDGPQIADLEVAPDEGHPDLVAIFTHVDGQGSKASFYLSRDEARQLAIKLLLAAQS